MKKTMARLLALVLALIMMCPTTALAIEAETLQEELATPVEENVLGGGLSVLGEETEAQEDTIFHTETVSAEDMFPTDSDTLFALYLNEELGLDAYEGSAYGVGTVGDSLTGCEKDLYAGAVGVIERVLTGNKTDNTVIARQYYESVAAMAVDLGLEESELFVGDALSETAMAAVQAQAEEHASNVFSALVQDYPGDLYWSAKTFSCGAGYGSDGNGEFLVFTFALHVSHDYGTEANGGGTDPDTDNADTVYITLDTTKADLIQTVKENASAVVLSNSEETPAEMLKAYAEYVCDQVTYNYDAANWGSDVLTWDPWQLVYVFDNDPTTNVVCEGYAKAFKYLCDLSELPESVKCYTVTGTTTGPHMWNLVEIDGNRTLVDVTAMDAQNDQNVQGIIYDVFMATPAPDAVNKTYPTYDIYYEGGAPNGGTYYGTITYTYDQVTMATFGEERLTLGKAASDSGGVDSAPTGGAFVAYGWPTKQDMMDGLDPAIEIGFDTPEESGNAIYQILDPSENNFDYVLVEQTVDETQPLALLATSSSYVDDLGKQYEYIWPVYEEDIDPRVSMMNQAKAGMYATVVALPVDCQYNTETELYELVQVYDNYAEAGYDLTISLGRGERLENGEEWYTQIILPGETDDLGRKTGDAIGIVYSVYGTEPPAAEDIWYNDVWIYQGTGEITGDYRIAAIVSWEDPFMVYTYYTDDYEVEYQWMADNAAEYIAFDILQAVNEGEFSGYTVTAETWREDISKDVMYNVFISEEELDAEAARSTFTAIFGEDKVSPESYDDTLYVRPHNQEEGLIEMRAEMDGICYELSFQNVNDAETFADGLGANWYEIDNKTNAGEPGYDQVHLFKYDESDIYSVVAEVKLYVSQNDADSLALRQRYLNMGFTEDVRTPPMAFTVLGWLNAADVDNKDPDFTRDVVSRADASGLMQQLLNDQGYGFVRVEKLVEEERQVVFKVVSTDGQGKMEYVWPVYADEHDDPRVTVVNGTPGGMYATVTAVPGKVENGELVEDHDAEEYDSLIILGREEQLSKDHPGYRYGARDGYTEFYLPGKSADPDPDVRLDGVGRLKDARAVRDEAGDIEYTESVFYSTVIAHESNIWNINESAPYRVQAIESYGEEGTSFEMYAYLTDSLLPESDAGIWLAEADGDNSRYEDIRVIDTIGDGSNGGELYDYTVSACYGNKLKYICSVKTFDYATDDIRAIVSEAFSDLTLDLDKDAETSVIYNRYAPIGMYYGVEETSCTYQNRPFTTLDAALEFVANNVTAWYDIYDDTNANGDVALLEALRYHEDGWLINSITTYIPRCDDKAEYELNEFVQWARRKDFTVNIWEDGVDDPYTLSSYEIEVDTLKAANVPYGTLLDDVQIDCDGVYLHWQVGGEEQTREIEGLWIIKGADGVTTVGDVGTKTFEVFFLPDTARDNYDYPTETVKVKVVPYTLGEDEVRIFGDYTYTGEAIIPAFAVTVKGDELVLGEDYTVTYKNNVKAGEAAVTIKGKGNYTGTVVKTFTIAPKPIVALDVADVADMAYTGKALKPKFVLTDTMTGKAVKEKTDYTVSYTEVYEEGGTPVDVEKPMGLPGVITTVTVTFTGVGNYTGTVTTEFAITPKVESITLDTNFGAIVDGVLTLSTTDYPQNNTFTLTAATYPELAADGIEWKSGNKKIADVDENGVVTLVPGAKPGNTTITATAADGSKVKATVKIVTVVPVTEITLTPDQGALATGKSISFKAATNPDATNKKVTWSLEGYTPDAKGNYEVEGVVTLTSSGKLTADKNYTGDAVTFTVVATAQDNLGCTKTQDVTITPAVTSVVIMDDGEPVTTVTMAVRGDPLQLTAATFPESAADDIVWTINNDKYASLDAQGALATILANAPGSATITATAADGSGKKATVKVNVVVPVTDLTLMAGKEEVGAKVLTLAPGKNISFKATTNADATNKKVTWQLAVDGDGYDWSRDAKGNYTLTKAGTDIVVATLSSSGKLTADKNYTGKPVDVTVIAWPADGIKPVNAAATVRITPAITVMDGDMPLDIKAGVALQVPTGDNDALTKATLYVPNAADLTWKNSSDKVAEVESRGDHMVITAVGKGSSTITLTHPETKAKISFKVNVVIPVTELTLTPESASLGLGKSISFKAAANKDATNKKVVWTLTTDAGGYTCTADAKGNYTLTQDSTGMVVAKLTSSGKLSVEKKAEFPAPVTVTVRADAADGQGAGVERTVTLYPALATGVTITMPDAVEITAEKNGVATAGTWATAFGKTLTLTADTTAPEGALVSDEVTWKSSSAKVAVIEKDEDGNDVLVAVGEGTATLTATAADGSGKKATYKLKIVEREVYIEETVLMEEEGFKVTAVGLDLKNMWYPELKLYVENNTDMDVTFQSRCESINGYAVDVAFSPNIPAGSKIYTNIKFYPTYFKYSNIKTIESIDFFFHIFRAPSANESYYSYDSAPIHIETSAYGTGTQVEPDMGTIVYDENGLRIGSIGVLKGDTKYEKYLLLSAENYDERILTLQLDKISVNGVTTTGYWYYGDKSFMPGGKGIYYIVLDPDNLEANGISNITSIEVSFNRIYLYPHEDTEYTGPILMTF